MTVLRRLFTGAAAIALVAVLLVGGPAGAAPGYQPTVDASIRFLQKAQNSDGGFGTRAGGESDPISTSWVALALAAAGINPYDQALPGGRNAMEYLVANTARFSDTTDYERTLMVANAAGAPARDFGGVDLVEPIVSRQLPDGSFPHRAGETIGGVNDTTFAVLALAPLDEPGLDGRVSRAVAWLVDAQKADGSFASTSPSGPSDVDITASAIEALRAAGRSGTATERDAIAYLRSTQNDDGGFPHARGEASNSNSTAWALQALWAASLDPASWSKPGGDPLRFLASLQQPDGSIRWKPQQTLNPVWTTAYSTPALAGRPLPVAEVPRKPPGPDPTPTPGPTPSPGPGPGPGDGGPPGVGDSPGGGVIYGGTGNGAPVGSRPSPNARESAEPKPKTGADTRSDERDSGSKDKRRRSAPAPKPDGESDRGGRAGTPLSEQAARDGAPATTSPGDTVDGLVLGNGTTPTRQTANPGARLRAASGDGDSDDGDTTLLLIIALGLATLGGSAAELRRPARP